MLYEPLLVDVESPELTDVESEAAHFLSERLQVERFFLRTLDEYYNGEQRVNDLGISTPPALKALHTINGWPGLVVDTLDERLDVEGFRYPQSTVADQDLWDIWQENNLDEESELAHLDALVFGRAFVMVGQSQDQGSPLITVEAPTNMSVRWTARSRKVSAGLQVYEMDGDGMAALYLPTSTTILRQHDFAGSWELVERDEHGFGECPVVMVANRQRSNDRYGRSEITPAVRSLTDAASRTLRGLEAAREFYSVPRRYALGVSESAFQDKNGNPKDAWEAYQSVVWALERDETGNAPTVGQFAAMNPTVFTHIVDMYAKLMSGITGMPPHYLGQTTTNPASADAIRSAEARLNKKAERKQVAFGGGWEAVMRLALRMVNKGNLPDDAKRIETIWASVATPTPAATAAALVPQVVDGIIPPTSDVLLERLGYSPLERERISIERQRNQAEIMLAEVATSVQAKQSRMAARLTSTVNKQQQEKTGPKPKGGSRRGRSPKASTSAATPPAPTQAPQGGK